MRTHSLVKVAAVGLTSVVAVAALAACGSKSTSTASGSVNTASATAGGPTTVCAGVAGDQLVTLADDKKLQNSDNIVPVVKTDAAKAPLTDVLNKVSGTLSQTNLNALNKATDVDRESSEEAAQKYVSDNGLGSGFSGGSGSVTVIAANFAENLTLANVYADALKGAGYATSVKQSTNREIYLASVERGEAQVVPEYAATLTEFLNQAANGANAATKASPEISTTIAALTPLAAAKGLTVLQPAAATDENAFAVTKAFAEKYGVTTLSQLKDKCGGGLTLGGPAECPQRPFCEVGLKNTYGLTISGFTPLDAGGALSKAGLKQGKVALALVFSSDASVTPAAS